MHAHTHTHTLNKHTYEETVEEDIKRSFFLFDNCLKFECQLNIEHSSFYIDKIHYYLN